LIIIYIRKSFLTIV